MAVPWGLLLLLQICVTLATGSVLKDFWQRSQLTKRNARVSFKECNLDNGEKSNCGYFGVSAEECASRECCWREVDTEGVPWCYHSKPTIKKGCMVVTDTRVECGSYGIRKETCLNKGCCWQPSNDPSAPWCYHYQTAPVYTGECGVPSIAPAVSSSRIVGGDEAIPNSWPWQVSLQAGRHFCGGSLINEQWVVSAAHCARGVEQSDSKVVLGLHRQNSEDEFQIAISPEEVIVHEDYLRETIDNDIMLIKLAEPVTFNEAITPVCLPDQGEQHEPGLRVYTTGWGTTTFMGEGAEALQQVEVPVVTQDTCSLWFNSTDWPYGGSPPDVTGNMICVGFMEGGRSACHGDSGGPLVRFENDHWTLIGIVSWGGECAGELQPGVYCRSANYIDWIQRKISEHYKKKK